MNIEPDKDALCIKYLTELLDGDLEREDVGVYGWKDKVMVNKPEIFHRMCQRLEVRELTVDRDGHLFCKVGVPESEGKRQWILTTETTVEEFLEKYSQSYSIRRLN
jgi:hypothetical protein